MRRLLSTCLLMVATAAGAFGQQGSIQPLGTLLNGRDVYGLTAAHGNIYAAADTAGVFRHDPDELTPFGWSALGLQGKHCREIAVNPAAPLNILVALDQRAGDSSEAEVIYRTTDGGATWALSQSGIAISSPPVNIITRLRFHPSDPSRVLLSGTGFGHYLSSDTGKTWQRMEGLTPYTIDDIIWDSSRPGVMFAGGETMIFSPVLLKSTDWGATWTNKLDVTLGGDNAIDGIAISHTDPDVMVAGTEGYILRSTDAGEHWTIMAHPERYYFFGVAWDYANPSRVFVAGGNHPPFTGGIYISNDAGASWSAAAQEQTGTIQRAITSPAFPGLLIFSAGHLQGESGSGAVGVFIFSPQAAGAPDDAKAPEAWFDGRTINLTATAREAPLRWELYDLLGNAVASGSTLPGEHETIETDQLPAGSYLFRYLHRGERKVLKVSLAR